MSLRSQNRISRWPGAPTGISRRDWLRTASAAAAGLWLAPPAWLWSAETAGSDPRLIVHEAAPFNAETALAPLGQQWLTPTAAFYVRCNGPQPQVEEAAYRLQIDGLVEREVILSLAELRERFEIRETTATLCCAGNRRDEFNPTKPVKGLPWRGGAIGNARWSGVRLSDVLRAAGVRGDAQHVWAEGLDVHEKGGRQTAFGASIPLARALADDPGGDVLIATHMNGEPLTTAHGAPARLLVPGYIGARSVKWLSRITLSDRPSDNYYVQRAYKLVTEDTPAAWEAAAELRELPLQAVICSARLVTAKKRSRLEVKGYALAPGRPGAGLARVEVSADGGQSWTAATLEGRPQPYCWQLWSAELRQRQAAERVLVRAIDTDWRMQPQTPAWNLQGYMFNGWHSAPVEGET